MAKNVLGTELKICCTRPMTGFYRTGKCETGREDRGLHLVCAQMTAEFLNFSKSCGNDLTTPVPMFQFPGLTPGDRWCVCVARWVEAFNAGVAPPVILEATHISVLEFVTLDELQQYAL
ncbi:MAG: DUF2237 domain-containing protein [Gemmatimonadetes bacterium]|nr:MAG: DUF2237 domain-containing protein [Gemmatimonadota bacterium]